MNYYFYDKKGHPVYLTFSSSQFIPDARHVLIFALTGDGGVILTKHKTRGWEVPGGKVEPGESPEEAAHRELLEETGVKVAGLSLIGQYRINQKDVNQQIVKNIYRGTVVEKGDIPEGFETESSIRFDFGLQAFCQGFSPFIQDNVFPLCIKFLSRKETRITY